MKAIVINDPHFFSKYNDDKTIKAKLDALSPNGPVLVVLNGDMVDMSCCAKKDVKAARAYQLTLQNKWGKFYVRGNHDLLPKGNAYLIVGKTLFTHGHLVGSSERVGKWVQYENKEAGAGRFKLMWVDFADDMDWIKGQRPLPEDIINAAVAMAKLHGCTEVILGHYHPLKELRYFRDGIHVRCLPKGFNEIEIVG